MTDITTKAALLTGSATGLGKRTAIELARKGINIVINYRNSQDEADKLRSFIKGNYGVECSTIKGDISSVNDCETIIKHCFEVHNHIDIVINNAGPYIHKRKNLIEYEIDEWNYIINGNLNGVFYLVKALIPKMRENRWGRVINFGFDRAETAPGWYHRSAFAAAKVGLVSLTKTLALEEANYGITANMICPGEIANEWKVADILDVRSIPDEHTPIGRPGTGEDIARIVSFLCEKNSDFVTGSMISVTGGKDVISKMIR